VSRVFITSLCLLSALVSVNGARAAGRETLASAASVTIVPTGPVAGVPARVTVRDADRVHALAATICNLPPFPSRIHCPRDTTLRYLAIFAGEAKAITIDPFGCEAVTGLARARWAARSPRFWTVLGNAVGISQATVQTFQGHAR
jgi:hypothetical protein